MENYIVRIYRHEKDKPQRFMGIVEKVGEEGKKAFTQYDELWEILNTQPGRAGKETAAKAGSGKGKK
jgi:hypothetical protein